MSVLLCVPHVEMQVGMECLVGPKLTVLFLCFPALTLLSQRSSDPLWRERKEDRRGQELLSKPRNVGVVPRERTAMRASSWGDSAKSFKTYLTALSPSMISIGNKRNNHCWSESRCKDPELNSNIEFLLTLKPYYSLWRVVRSFIR